MADVAPPGLASDELAMRLIKAEAERDQAIKERNELRKRLMMIRRFAEETAKKQL